MGVSSQVLKQLVSSYVLSDEAAKNGIGASEADVVRLIKDGKYFQNDKGQFDPKVSNFLKSQGYTEKPFSEYLKRSLVSEKVRGFITGTYVPSKGGAELSYRLDNTKYNVSFVKLDPTVTKLLLVKLKLLNLSKQKMVKSKLKTTTKLTSLTSLKKLKLRQDTFLSVIREQLEQLAMQLKRSKADAKKLAKKVAAEAKSKKSSFANIAKKYTDEPGGKAKGGDLGWFDAGVQWLKSFLQ